jgi:hypothetical protein
MFMCTYTPHGWPADGTAEFKWVWLDASYIHNVGIGGKFDVASVGGAVGDLPDKRGRHLVRGHQTGGRY